MQNRKHAGARDGEQRHGFRKSVDRRAPVLFEQKQDRRDQRARVADSDPPDEIDDGESPGDGDHDAPDADAPVEQPRHRNQQNVHQQEGAREADEHLLRRLQERLVNHAADLVGDGAEVVAGTEDLIRSGIYGRDARSVFRFETHAFSRSGFGLRRRARYVVRGRVFNSSSSRIIAMLLLQLGDAAVGIVQIAEHDRLRRDKPAGTR